jgi:alpha-beta hydrolase superfamily lysophospholipase
MHAFGVTTIDSDRPTDAVARAPFAMRLGRRGATLAAAMLGGLVLAAASYAGLERVAVHAIVHAPNAGHAPFAAIPGEMLVDVGPPAAVLSIVVMNASNPRGTVFVLPGIRDSKESMLGWGEMLVDDGYRVVLVDLRGQGRSTGSFLTYGVQESADLSQVLDTLTAQHVVAGPFGVMGNSYGAATAIQWAGRDHRITAVVAVSPFASLRAIVPAYGILPMPASFVNRIIALAGERGGFDPDAASPVDAIGRTEAPVLIVHGRGDTRIPSWHSERIHEAGAGHSELVLVDGEGHETVGSAPRTHLAERTARWFGEFLR